MIEINVDNYNLNQIKELEFKQQFEYKIFGNNQYYGEYIRNTLKEKKIFFLNTIDKDNIKYWFDKEFNYYDVTSKIDLIFDSILKTDNLNIDYLEIYDHISDYKYLCEVLENKNEKKIIIALKDIYEKLGQNDENFDKYFAVFLRLFYLSYTCEMYDVAIKIINLFFDKYNLKFIVKYKMFILKHFINIYEYMEKNQSIYETLFAQYSQCIHDFGDLQDIYYDDNIKYNFKYEYNLFYFESVFHRHEFTSTIEDITKYLTEDINKKDNRTTMSLKLIELVRFMYKYIRALANDYKWKTNNFYIEYVLDKAYIMIEELFDFSEDLHKMSGGRIISLISAKNMLKARYSLDNIKYNLDDIADDFEKELKYFLNKNFHCHFAGAQTKAIQSIGEMQMIYNIKNKKKNIYDLFHNEIQKYLRGINNTDFFKMNLFKDIQTSTAVILETQIALSYYHVFRATDFSGRNKVLVESFNFINATNKIKFKNEKNTGVCKLYDENLSTVY